MISGLRTVCYPVRELAAAKRWYAAAFEVEPYFEEPYYVGFTVGGFELGLIPDGTPGPQGATAYWGVGDVAAESKRLVGLGAKLVEPAHEVGGGIIVATLADPDGNHIGLIHNPFFNREVVQ